MDEKSDQILDHIETQRDRLGRNLDELETRVRSTTDWRTHFDRNPALVMGLALGGGILVGAMVGGRSSSSRSYSTGSTGSTWSSGGRSKSDYSSYRGTSGEEMGFSSQERHSSPAVAQQRERASETFDHIKAALIGFGIAKAKEFMTQALPGFGEHLNEAEQGGRSGSQAGGQSGSHYSSASGNAGGDYRDSSSFGSTGTTGMDNPSDYSSTSTGRMPDVNPT